MSRLFDLKDIGKKTDVSTRVINAGFHLAKFLHRHDEKIESVKNLIGRPPVEGEIYFLWTMKSFNAFTFIPYIFKESGIIDELVISTYSINIRIIDALVKYVDQKRILSVVIFISDTIRTHNVKVYDHLMALSEKYPIEIKYCWNHSKVTLMLSDGNYYGVEGSGNFGENAQHEQYIFYNSKEEYEFRKNAILHAIKS